MRLEGESFAIAGGQLTARTPGRLKFRSKEAQSVLGQQDENVDNMLAALEDFHYEELSMTLDKTAEQDLTLQLSILGNNPAVLKGQPFRININLESNIDNILNALSEGLAISNERIRRLWQEVRQR